jgi:hypothetical protein
VIVAVRQNCSQSKKQKSPPDSGGHLKAQTNRLSSHRQRSCTRRSKTNRSDRRGTPKLLSINKKQKKAPQILGGISNNNPNA